MRHRTPDPSARDRLRALLGARPPGGTPSSAAAGDALAAARALGPEAAGEVVAELLDAYVPGADAATAARAADLALQLRLARAVPALVSCLERLTEYQLVAHAAARTLERMGAPAAGALLQAFERAGSPEARYRLGSVLARVGGSDARIRAVLTPMLADDPVAGARLLTALGRADALPDLSTALDRLSLPDAGAEDELDRHEEIVAVAQAVFALRGKLTPEQRTKFERAYARSDEIWARGGPDPEDEEEDRGS